MNGVAMMTEMETTSGPNSMGSLLTEVDLANAPAKCPSYPETDSNAESLV